MAVDINGDGLIALGGTSTTQGRVRLAEDTDNGTNYVELTANAAVTSNRTVTFPDADINFVNGLGVAQGGTGQTTYTDGQLLIGNTTGNTLAKNTLTAGTGISITNGSGTITIATSGGGGITTDIDMFNSPGTFTTPANTTKVLAYVVSGGGGGGGGEPSNGNVGGSGGSGVLGAAFLTVTGSTPYAITVGTGGAGTNFVPGPGARNAAGAGNASSFGNLLTANGGGGGGNSTPSTNGNTGNVGTSPLSQVPAQPSPGAASAVWSPNAGAPGAGGSSANGTSGSAGRVLIFY